MAASWYDYASKKVWTIIRGEFPVGNAEKYAQKKSSEHEQKTSLIVDSDDLHAGWRNFGIDVYR